MKHSKWGLRLNHDVTTVPCTHSQLINMQKHFIYMYYGFVKHSKWGLRLNHDVTTSDRSVPTPKEFLKIDPKLRQLSG